MVTTHQHGDHWQALLDGADGHRRPLAAPHAADADGIPDVDDTVADGDTVPVGRRARWR